MRRAGRGPSGFAAVGDDDVGGFGRRDGRVQRFDDRDGECPADDLRADEAGTEAGAIPAKVSENIRPMVMAGLAKLVEEVNQYAAPM